MLKIRVGLVTVLSVFLVVFLGSCGTEEIQNQESVKDRKDVSTNQDSESEFSMEYDELQQLYLDMNKDLTYNELLHKLESSALFYSEFDGQEKAIKIAFDEEVSPFRYAESGDYLKVNFNDNQGFNFATYFHHDAFITLLNYQNGTYYEFRDQPEYAGYYINDYDLDETITIKYSNGNETEAKYKKVESKTDQFKYLDSKK